MFVGVYRVLCKCHAEKNCCGLLVVGNFKSYWSSNGTEIDTGHVDKADLLSISNN